MPSHLRMIVQAKEGFILEDIVRDFKAYTGRAIIKQIIEEPESRRTWMLEKFKNAAGKHAKLENTNF